MAGSESVAISSLYGPNVERMNKRLEEDRRENGLQCVRMFVQNTLDFSLEDFAHDYLVMDDALQSKKYFPIDCRAL